MYSFTEHVAYQIAAALPEKSGSLLITGGGAYNDFLVARIQQYLPHVHVVIPNKKTIEFKEALIFGLLGVLRLRNEINVLHSVTGASKDHCAGYVFG
jgi:anhydro-N-acetylmuramic acid kinase